MLAVVMGVAILSVGHEVSALSCAPATLQEQINGATVIFAGKVTTVQTATSDKAAHALFDVTEYWKGQVGKKISVGGIYAWTGYANPPSYFIVGNTYLVFANSVPASSEAKNIPDNLIASINCGRTTLLESATEIKTALGQGKIPTGQSSFTFTKNLTVGFFGEDVVALQTFLEQRGFLIMPYGIAKGYFGGLTRSALVKYQRSEGITPAVGYFGPLTRTRINSVSSSTSSLDIIKPTINETWQIGTPHTIQWKLSTDLSALRGQLFLTVFLKDSSGNLINAQVGQSIEKGQTSTTISIPYFNPAITPGEYHLVLNIHDTIPALPCVGCQGYSNLVASATSVAVITLTASDGKVKPAILSLGNTNGKVGDTVSVNGVALHPDSKIIFERLNPLDGQARIKIFITPQVFSTTNLTFNIPSACNESDVCNPQNSSVTPGLYYVSVQTQYGISNVSGIQVVN